MSEPSVIDTVVSAVIASLPPIAGGDLEGFVYDLDEAMRRCTIVSSEPVVVRSDPRRLLDVRATLLDEVKTLQEIAEALAKVWRFACYLDFEASSIEWFKEATVLRFVTVPSARSYFVTGRVVVEGGRYPELVERFARDFKDVRGPLRSLGDARA